MAGQPSWKRMANRRPGKSARPASVDVFVDIASNPGPCSSGRPSPVANPFAYNQRRNQQGKR